jgi:hypothetical protein
MAIPNVKTTARKNIEPMDRNPIGEIMQEPE